MLLDYKSKEYKNWFRRHSEPVTYAELFTIKEHIRKDGANLTAILTLSKKNMGKLDGNIDRIKKYYGQT